MHTEKVGGFELNLELFGLSEQNRRDAAVLAYGESGGF